MKTPIKTDYSFVCARTLNQLLPESTAIKSALLFDGQIECELAFSDRPITITTNKYVIYEFWDCVTKNPYLIADMADALHESMDPQMIYLLQNDWPRFKDPFYRSALFFLLNRYSLNGTISHGNFSTDNYSTLCGKSLINFFENYPIDKLNIVHYNEDRYYKTLNRFNDDEILLLPFGNLKSSPLIKTSQEGHEKYDNNLAVLSNVLSNYDNKFVVIVKSNRRILKEMNKFNIFMVNNHGELTNDERLAEELIITNLDI